MALLPFEVRIIIMTQPAFKTVFQFPERSSCLDKVIQFSESTEEIDHEEFRKILIKYAYRNLNFPSVVCSTLSLVLCFQ